MSTLTLRNHSIEARPASRDNMAKSGMHPISSHYLLQGAKTISIAHNGAIYQLRATKFEKLILTK